MSTQAELAKAALALIDTLPARPQSGSYLSEAEAAAIVDDSLERVRESGDKTEIAYLTGHRRRLVETLTRVPKAPRDGARFLDIGCYGYFSLWACTHLGYASAVGAEMPLPDGDVQKSRTLKLGNDTITMDVFHFDLTDEDWPLNGMFDTVICLEVLEHVDQDPSGVLGRLRDRIVMGGTLVFSVPNCVSYKTLGEMYSGMPPWTYWFYNPDLSHEPRHSLEYTPFTNALILRAAGFEQQSFATIDAYKEREEIGDLYEVADRIGLGTRYFGETMISTAVKAHEEAVIRFPDAIYSADGYYESTWALVEKKRHVACETFLASQKSVSETNECLQKQVDTLKDESVEFKVQSAEKIIEMRRIIEVYEQTLDARNAEIKALRETQNSERDKRIMLYRLMAPARVIRVAEAGAMPEPGYWKRVFKRHPMKISLWSSLKRLHRRMKSPINQIEWKKLSNL